jgi:hypothetical protein
VAFKNINVIQRKVMGEDNEHLLVPITKDELKSCEFWLFISKELVDTGTQTICNYFVTI